METRNTLKLRYLGIDTYQHLIAYMRADCHICRSEGFAAQSRVLVRIGEASIIATLNVVHGDLLSAGECGLSDAAWRALRAQDGSIAEIFHPPQVGSLSHVRAKVYGHRLTEGAMTDIVRDISAGRYSDLDLAAFVTACAGDRLDSAETQALTRAMIAVGERLHWPYRRVMDKHCVGGLPGNRTTPIVVAIVAAAGLIIPKTSSRAITSPAGTADTMEVLAPVALDSVAMRRVVEMEGGCVVWGGGASLSPADDILVRVERPLELDSEGQLIASVLSKKAAAGSTHVVVDIPVGPTAKVRSLEAAQLLKARFEEVGRAIELEVKTSISDGTQPVGRGIGPSLEAMDVMAVLRRDCNAPQDLCRRAVELSALILEQASGAASPVCMAKAEQILASGNAWRKFQAICDAQGGMRAPPKARHTSVVTTSVAGRVVSVDNRRLARAAKLAGAPRAPQAGIEFLAPLGTVLGKGQPIFTVHAAARGELDYALTYLNNQPSLITMEAID